MIAFITPFPSEPLPDRVVLNAATASSNAKLKKAELLPQLWDSIAYR